MICIKNSEPSIFFARHSSAVIARNLLGHQVIYQGPQGLLSGLIVEDEAYGGANDSTSYAYQHRITKTSRPLYGNPGTMYIYTIHASYVFGIVDQPKGIPSGIMVRAIEPVHGKSIMIKNRQKSGVNLTNGPGKLMQALGIQDTTYNLKPCNREPLKIDLIHQRKPLFISTSARIGVSKGPNQNDRLRFYVTGNPYVSKMRKRDVRQDHGWQK